MFLTLSRGRKASESVKNISFCGNLLIGEASLASKLRLPARPVVRQQRKPGYASWGSMSPLGN